MAKKNVFLHFLSNYIVVLLLFFTLFVMGPSEIFFGNYKEFGFVYQEFGWKFLIFAFLISFIFTLVISFFPDKLGKYILSVFWGIGIAGYIQTMFLNRHLEQMGVRAEAYTASPSKIIVNSIIWTTIILGALLFAKFQQNIFKKVMLTSSLIILGMQCVGYISLFPSADKSAFTYYSDKDELILDGSKQFTVSSNDNIILFILDNFSSTYLASAVEKYPDLKDFLHDFTYYNNADCNYHGTYPSLPHLLTGNDLDPSLSVDDWLEECWTNTTTNDYFSILSDANYKVNLYTPTTSILTGSHSLPLLDGKISNITTKQSSICIDYHKLYKTMFYMSCYRFMPEYFKSFFDVSNATYTSIVSYPENTILHANYDFYNHLIENGLTTDSSGNYFIIQHLNGTHEFTTDENCQFDAQNATCQSTVKGIFTMLEAYLNELKTLGVYDDSTIIITSDHGDVEYPQIIFFIKEKQESHESLNGTNAPITLDELVPTIVQSLDKDYSEFGYSIHDFYPDQQRERLLYIRDYDASYPDVPRYDGISSGGSNVYHLYNYTGNIDDQINALQNYQYTTIPMVDSYF